MTTSPASGQVFNGRLTRIGTIAIAILLLSLLYLLEIWVARGPVTAYASIQYMARSAAEWTAWAIMAPFILRLADAVPIGPARPRRNLAVHVAAGALAMPVWAALVAAPMALFELPVWGTRETAPFLELAESGLLQRGAYLVIVYGLIVGFATARRLAAEREAAATRTEELHRELTLSDLARFTRLMGSDRLVERLNLVEAAMERSVDQAEAETLALAAELHESLIRTRDILRR